MKKILLLLFLAYSYSFSNSYFENAKIYVLSSVTSTSNNMCGTYNQWSDNSSGYSYTIYHSFGSGRVLDGGICSSPGVRVTYEFTYKAQSTEEKGVCGKGSQTFIDGTRLDCSTDTPQLLYIAPNPDSNGDFNCRELFQGSDGVAYTCNPNTNEATPIENSNGVIQDENGDDIPNCNEGYEHYITQNMSATGGGSDVYNSYGCASSSGSSETGTNENNDNTNGSSFPDAPTTSVGADGSTSWTWDDGTTQTLSPNGTLTTYYPDGTNSVKQVGNDYTPSTGGSGSSGGTATGGTGGTGGGGAGTNGNTTNETDTPNNNDNPIDETPVSNSCSDSSLTLQEKMLCEMNAGMKKLNSESTPENSLNNLINEMNKDNNTNTTAINTNIKETNKLLTDTKALNENQLSELKNVTNELKKLNATSGTSSSTITQPITDNFTPAENDTGGLGSSFESDKNLIDSFTGVYTDFKDNLLGHQDTLNNLINNTATTINGGIGLSLSTTEIINCPLNYNLDMTSTLGKNIPFNIDICEITSKTKPYLYPIFLILFTVGTVFFAFRFIGVLL